MEKEIKEKIKQLIKEKDYKEIIKICNEILNTNEDKIAYFYRGASMSSLKQYKEAIEDFDKVIDLKSNHKDAHYNRGLCKSYFMQYQYKEGKEADKYFKEAIEDFNKFIKLAKNDININFIVNTFINIMRIGDIKLIFRKLMQKNYNELFVNDPTFKLLKNKIESNNISNKNDIFNSIKNILLYQYLLLKSLSFSNMNYKNNNIEISYYTSLNTLLLLLNDKKEYENKEKYKNEKENKENEGKMRMVNISNANDPKEGKILENIFNKSGLDIKISNNEENLITLQTSYTRNKDSLTMFRLYGKNENKEATGICLVVDKEYFNDKFFSTPVQENIISTDYKNSNDNDNNEEEQIDNLKRNLYWILYYNEKENILVFNSDNFKYKNKVIDLNKSEKEIKLDNIENIIAYIFYNIFKYTKKLNTKLNKEIKDKTLKDKIFNKRRSIF